MTGRIGVDASNPAPPHNYMDLATVVYNGPTSAINVIGVVFDHLDPIPTRGSDLQMTFTIRDLSPVPNGLRIKFFRPSLNLFPAISNKGDVIILRNLKISRFANQLIGISSFRTEFIVFPYDAIAMPQQTVDHEVSNNPMRHTASVGARPPSMDEQQWAVTLKRKFDSQSNDSEVQPSAQPIAPILESVLPKPSSVHTPSANSTVIQTVSARNKFSLIKDIDAGDRGGGNRSGNFYDIAGEVVKLYSDQMNQGIVDLYVTDYTTNEKLPNKTAHDLDASGVVGWKGPSGKMTLHIELYPPHSVWTQQNVKEGEFVLLRNVRIKWNQQGLGSELEGNIWQDNKFPDKISVSTLYSGQNYHADLLARKTSYAKQLGKRQNTSKAKRKKNNKRKLTRAAMAAEDGTSANVDSNKSEDDSDAPDDEGVEQEASAINDNVPTAKKSINPNVECDHPDVPFSDLDLILNNPSRWANDGHGTKREYPFTNVKHHTKLRVVDYYPHLLEKFSLNEREGDHRKPRWKWFFWLVMTEGAGGADEPFVIVEVFGSDAEYLLGMPPCDLKNDPQKHKQLEESLFLLWGELGESKKQFLDSHPNIKPDIYFKAKDYNISVENLPFELCVAEYGKHIRINGSIGGAYPDNDTAWRRAYKMFGTKIKR